MKTLIKILMFFPGLGCFIPTIFEIDHPYEIDASDRFIALVVAYQALWAIVFITYSLIEQLA